MAVGPLQVRERGEHAGVHAGEIVERGDDVVEHRLVHGDERAPARERIGRVGHSTTLAIHANAYDPAHTILRCRRGGRSGVLYQIYPLSFADSNADGFGDLQGIVEHLDHLEWLGVDAIWLSPISPSPNADWGYDVADYCAVQPEMGTLASFDALVAAAHARGIRVLLDFVPNHTSEQHPWFVDSRSSRTSRAPRLVPVGRSEGRRLAAEQLGQQLRRPGLDARRDDRAVLHAQPPARAARSQLVERRGARRLRQDPAVLVRPRCRRFPHRRVQPDHQGRRAARQPARDPPTIRSTCRSWVSGRSTTATAPSCTTCCGGGARSPTPTTRRGSSSARRRSTTPRRSPRSTAPTSTSCSSRSTSRSSTRRSRSSRCARSSRRSRRCCRRARGRRGRVRTTTCSASRTRWAGDDPRAARVALLMLLGLRGTPVLVPGRRDRLRATSRWSRPICATRSA